MSKKLAHHSLPVVVFMAVFVVLVGYGFSRFTNPSNTIRQALTTHVLTIKPTRDGLAHIALNTKLHQPTPPVVQTLPSGLSAAASGESAQLYVEVQSLKT
jgi:hypothetical protein